MGLFLEEYEKLRLLGRGSFASVYKVRHHELGYTRAIKVSNELIADGDEDHAYQTFLNECKVLLRLGNGAHPNIVRIYQPRLIANKAIVEMDYVDGTTLSRYIASQQFIPYDEFCRFARQVVGAMAYCHVDIYRFLMDPDVDQLQPDPEDGLRYRIDQEKESQLIAKYGVNHNDLHSNNIMRRDYDGQYVLLDFGLAIQDGHCVKSSARGDGAYEYCSPEKLRGTAESITAASDVYSLGILLYEMLAGRVPFPLDVEKFGPEGARFEVYQHHLNDEPPAIEPLRRQAFEAAHPGQTYVRDYPEALDYVISRCLSKSPDDRYPNAKALLNALKQIIDQPVPKPQPAVQSASPLPIVTDAELVNKDLQRQLSSALEQLMAMRRSQVVLNSENNELRQENSRLHDALAQMEASHGPEPQHGRSPLARKLTALSTILMAMLVGVSIWLYLSTDYWRVSDAMWDKVAIVAGAASFVASLVVLVARRANFVVWAFAAAAILATAIVDGFMVSFVDLRAVLGAVAGVGFVSMLGAMFASSRAR